MDGQPGEFPDIPGYRLQTKLGEGGMGTVYHATQLTLWRTVAVKLLHPVPDAAPLHAFQCEAELMASLAHPGVVTIHDSGLAGDRPFLVMEYVPGPNLRDLLRPGRTWPVGPALHVLDGIARALSYIHGHGILHLDLKPENVLLGGTSLLPAPKITDFGLALTLGDARTFLELLVKTEPFPVFTNH